MAKKKTVIAAALGECVHVAGVTNFLRLAETRRLADRFPGSGRAGGRRDRGSRERKSGLWSASPTASRRKQVNGYWASLPRRLQNCTTGAVRFVFGGTPPVAERAARLGFFERVFNGSELPEEVLAFLKGQAGSGAALQIIPQTTVERIHWKSPYPLLRHHFGLPRWKYHIAGHRKNRRSEGIGCHLTGDRPGRAGEFLPPRTTGPAPERGRRRAGAFGGRLPRPLCCQPAR